jgi:hypothetical protein
VYAPREKMMNRRIFLATMTTVVLLLSVSGYSSAQSKRIRKYVIVPVWRIQLLDSAGNPVKKAVVRQIWQDYDVEDQSHEEDLETDDHGYVRFPERFLKTSPKAKALGRARHRRELGVHASFGPDAYILAWADELEGFINYKVGEPLPTQLIMRPKKM